MPKDKIKPPAETKAQLMLDIIKLMEESKTSQADDILFLLNFFTAADLVGIRDELKK